MNTANRTLLNTLKIKYPIFQAPMAGVSTVELASKVTNYGGLGSLPLAGLDFTNIDSLQKLNAMLNDYHSQVNDEIPSHIVNLNFFCHDIYSPPTNSQINNWKSLYGSVLSTDNHDMLNSLNYDKNGNVSFKQFEQSSSPGFSKLMEFLTHNIQPAIVSFHFGTPSVETITQFQQNDIMVFVTSTSLDETIHLYDLGVDGIILQGYEAGGHRGNFLSSSRLDENLSTHALFTQLIKYLNTRPVSTRALPYLIPAGGIHDSNTVKYYLDAGAAGVQIGSAFLSTPECTTHTFYRAISEQQKRIPTVMINSVLGKYARAIKTKFIENMVYNNKFSEEELPPYGYMYNAYKELKPKVAHSQDIGFYLAGQNYYENESDALVEDVMNKLTQ